MEMSTYYVVGLDCIPLLPASAHLTLCHTMCSSMPARAKMNVTLSSGSFNYFQIFLVSSYAMQLIKVQFKNNLCQLISIENDFSLKSSIKCWLPALRVSQGMDFVSNLSVLGLPSLLLWPGHGKEESEKSACRIVFWLESELKQFSFCTSHGLCHTIRHSSVSSSSSTITN